MLVLWTVWTDEYVMEAFGSAAMARIMDPSVELRLCVYGAEYGRIPVYTRIAERWGVDLVLRPDDKEGTDARKWREIKEAAPCLFCDSDILFFSAPCHAPVSDRIRIFGLNESPIMDRHRVHDDLVSSVDPSLPTAAIPGKAIPCIEAWYGERGRESTFRFNTGFLWCPGPDLVGPWLGELAHILRCAGGAAAKCAVGEHALTSLFLAGRVPEIELGVWPRWGAKMLDCADWPQEIFLDFDSEDVIWASCSRPIDALHAMHAEDRANERLIFTVRDDGSLTYRSGFDFRKG